MWASSYVGIIKGVGRVYQQTDIDTYRKVAQAKGLGNWKRVEYPTVKINCTYNIFCQFLPILRNLTLSY